MSYPIRQIFLGILLLPIILFGQENQTNFHHITEEDGLSTNKVFHSIQDKQGFVWLATQSGLCKYDGFGFKNFTVEDGIARNDIRKVYLDSQDRLWILTRRELSLRVRDDFSIPSETYEYLRDERVVDIQEDSSQTLWFSSPRIISYLDTNGTHKQLRLPSEKLGAQPHLLFVNPKNELFILYDRTIYVVVDHKIVRNIPLLSLQDDQGFPSTAILLIDGSILYSSEKGLVRLVEGSSEELFFSDFPQGFSTAGIVQLFQDKDGDIWVVHSERGILRLNFRQGRIDPEPLLAGIGLNHIMEDAEGDIWFSTQNKGLYLLSRNALQMQKTQSKINLGSQGNGFLMNHSFIDMDSYGSGNLHLAEAGKILEIEAREGQFYLLRESPAPLGPREQLLDLLMLSERIALLRTSRRFFLYESGVWKEIYGFIDPQAMSRGPKGDILISYELEKTIKLSLSELFSLSEAPETAPDRIISFEVVKGLIPTTEGIQLTQEDQQGTIWSVWVNGLYRIMEGKKVRYPKDQSIFNADIQDLKISKDSLVWIATNGSGVIAIGKQKLSFLNQEKGIQGLVCNAIFTDSLSGHVWVATQTGLGRISDYDFDSDTFNIKWFDDKDGLHSNELKLVHRYGNYLWIAGLNGLSLMDDAKIQEESYSPPVYILKLESNNYELDLNVEHKFAPSQNNIAIHFTGISFRNLGKLGFEYQLNNKGWIKVNSNPVRFESLSKGNYHFQIRAKSRDGLESKVPAEIQFEILPAFYQTWWFRSLMILGFGLFVIGLLRYLYSERQRILLEDTVEEKTFELSLKIEELHRSNQDLKQFAYVASHDLKTPLRTVIGHLQLLKIRMGGKLDNDGEKAMNFAVDSSKAMYEMINHLLDYSRLGKESLQFEYFNLADILSELEKSLMSVIKERNASITYESFPDFKGVPTQWKILFQNLIENAIKFNEKASPHVVISYKDSPDFWILSVKDNGIGIKEEYQPKIFDLFQRLHTHEYPGSGIGLAKCKRIVELHGGSIWIDSVEGQGTDFQFTIAKRLEN